ncbi:MAG: type II toxin-antitoxin system HicB family antitoxin [Bryobacteraceae bacterium]|jgi:predicted RNase H-like HicB family nuclease
MTRKYSLVIEGNEAGYSAYAPELPTILVTGGSMDELSARAKEAICLLDHDAGRSVSYLFDKGK